MPYRQKITCLTNATSSLVYIVAYEGMEHNFYGHCYTRFFSLEKKGILISCQSRSVVRPSVRPSMRTFVRPVMFLVNVSPHKPLEVATSNFVGDVEGTGRYFV